MDRYVLASTAADWLESQHSHDLVRQVDLQKLADRLSNVLVIADDVWMISLRDVPLGDAVVRKRWAVLTERRVRYSGRSHQIVQEVRAEYASVADVGGALCLAIVGKDPGAGLALIGDAWSMRVHALRAAGRPADVDA